ncbi:MAG: DUF3450 family protein [Candidatus Omnitrophota bacterium]|nr:DUF3450 family protein [Candidatus Omnitrophota bacterium]
MEKIKKIGTDTFFCLFFLVCLLSSAAMSDNLPAGETGVDAGNVDSTRAALEKWVETRRIISQEKRDWAFGREMLTERIELVEREIESLKSKIREAEKNITETDKKRAGMVEENEKLKEASTALSSTVMTLEAHTGELLKRLPDPIRERVKPLSQRLPDNSDEAKLSLSERFQNIVGILNEINKFNRDITVTSEVHKLPDGTSAEVTAFYVGIGQAYYASSNGNAAGAGTASADGWIWTPANKAAAEILEAIAILKNEKAASFVQLPVEIQ